MADANPSRLGETEAKPKPKPKPKVKKTQPLPEVDRREAQGRRLKPGEYVLASGNIRRDY